MKDNEHNHNHDHCECHSHEHHHEHKHEHHHDNLKCDCCHDDEHEDESRSVVIKRMIFSAISLGFAIFLEHAVKNQFFEGTAINSFLSTQTSEFDIGKSIYLIFYLISYLLIAKPIFHGAINNIRKGNIFGEQFLMCIASLGAIFIGEYAEGVAVILLYTLGEFFQDYAVDKSRDSISALMDIRPDVANVVRNGSIISINPSEVKIDEIIEVKPGERIALDGEIVEGETFTDTSALTGESVPRKVKIGDEVLAGFVNKSGVVRVRVTKLYEESAVTRILELTQESSSVKSKSEKFITRFSKVYTPIVCIAALVVAFVPPLFLKIFALETFNSMDGFSTWIYRALMFLVVSCPCALVISVPLSFFSGIGAASKKGILIKGSNFMENLSKISTVVFDKTGTLTKGVFKVSKINAINISESELLKFAAAVESKSNHPIAKSIIEEYCERFNSTTEKINNFSVKYYSEISGKGVKAEIDGKIVLAGNSKLIEMENISDFQNQRTNINGTVIHIAIDGKYSGFLVISDEIKENSQSAIKNLKKNGVKKAVMLTGDNEQNAKIVAAETCIDEYHANLLPEDKVSELEKLFNSINKNEKIAFIGDGINDSPVLARADVGIAMGALGSDAAIEAADVVVMDDNLERLSDGIKIARKTVSIVTQNIVLSLGVKIAIMILSALGITNMWVAVFGDVGVCFLAILNAMRALR